MAKFKLTLMISMLALVCYLPTTALGLTVVECVDKSGDSTFAERCPPGTQKKSEKQLRGLPSNDDAEVSIEEIAKDHPVTLFSVENCEACSMVRTQLQARDIPFTEIDVGSDQEKYEQLTTATGGSATVPTLTVDGKVLTGYNSASLEDALNAAGYP